MADIGILGGTFNPIHNGHLLLAKAAYEALSLNKVLIMPSGISYLKKDIVILSKESRAEMTKLAIEEYPYFEFSDIELMRDGNTYTFETLLQLKKTFPDDIFYFITGADTVFSIESWKNPDIVLSNCVLSVMLRDDVSIKELEDKCLMLKDKYKADYRIIDSPAIDISSSYIRKKLSENKHLEIKNMLPTKVYDYILENNLYIK